MILPAKIPLYNFWPLTALFSLSTASLILAFTRIISFGFFWSLIAVILTVFFIFDAKRKCLFASFRSVIDELEGKTNLLSEEVEIKKKKLKSIPFFSRKVSFLFSISQSLIELSKNDEILDFMVNTVGDLFPQADSVLLFTFNKDKLVLARSHKNQGKVIKGKHGDVLEKWILKNNQSLVIDDITKDFRFDCNKIVAYKDREASSFIVAPLSIGEKTLGSMRVESISPGAFSFDDSRLLRSVCDLGIVVLERAGLFAKTEEMAIKDSLTGLFMRDYFFNRFREDLKRAAKSKMSLGVIMIDIDDFKVINDSYGHIVGDIVLKHLAKIIHDAADEPGNLAGRFGGEEFMILSSGCGRQELIVMAESIRKKVEDIIVKFRRREVKFTISIGLSVFPEDGADVLDLVDKADHNLYKAKSEGKNRVIG